MTACKSVGISRGLISVQCFQLILASLCYADSVGVHFVAICTQFHTRITLTPNKYCVFMHVAMVLLVNGILQSVSHIVSRWFFSYVCHVLSAAFL